MGPASETPYRNRRRHELRPKLVWRSNHERPRRLKVPRCRARALSRQWDLVRVGQAGPYLLNRALEVSATQAEIYLTHPAGVPVLSVWSSREARGCFGGGGDPRDDPCTPNTVDELRQIYPDPRAGKDQMGDDERGHGDFSPDWNHSHSGRPRPDPAPSTAHSRLH